MGFQSPIPCASSLQLQNHPSHQHTHTDRHRHRHRHTDTETQTQRHTDTETQRHRDTQTHTKSFKFNFLKHPPNGLITMLEIDGRIAHIPHTCAQSTEDYLQQPKPTFFVGSDLWTLLWNFKDPTKM